MLLALEVLGRESPSISAAGCGSGRVQTPPEGWAAPGILPRERSDSAFLERLGNVLGLSIMGRLCPVTRTPRPGQSWSTGDRDGTVGGGWQREPGRC